MMKKFKFFYLISAFCLLAASFTSCEPNNVDEEVYLTKSADTGNQQHDPAKPGD
ncbi:hypothetical protein [Ascidiimonas aurantiaca]|uniref:hypothetical protein n=1 Tax=Ascidiimonas aurantiaca TaxID=1685432 RepID=UPI0030EB3ED3